MRRLLLFVLPLIGVMDSIQAQDKPPAISYGRVTMSGGREYEMLDLLGIQANELTATITDPVYGARLKIEVWEPGDKEPRWTGRFGIDATFKEKTAITYTFRLYFVPPKLKGTVPSETYPAWLTWEMRRGGAWAADNPTAWLGKARLALPDNYLAIEGYELSRAAGIYDVKAQKFDQPVPFFDHYVSKGGYGITMLATPEATRKANPDCVHIIAWLEPLLEKNDFYAPARPKTGDGNAKELNASSPLPLLPIGSPAPKWELSELGGKQFSSEALKGKISVVNFWATWCGHCLVEMPDFVALQEKFRGDGVQFIGLNVDRELSVPGLERFLKWHFVETPINYPVLLAPESTEKLFGGIDGLPTTYIIDAEGKVVFGCKGEFAKGDLERRLRTLLPNK